MLTFVLLFTVDVDSQSHQVVTLCVCVCVFRLVSQGDILTVPAENHPDLLEHGSEGIHTYVCSRTESRTSARPGGCPPWSSRRSFPQL